MRDALQEVRPLVLEQTFSVDFSYPVIFTRRLFGAGNDLLLDVLRRLEPERRHRVLVCLDAGLVEAAPSLPTDLRSWFSAREGEVELAGEPLLVPGGEAAKNRPELILDLVRVAMERRLCRHSFILGVGGGAVLDAVGLAAALFHRGLRLIRVPTTVLAQNDAGVGVKNGINFGGVKNALGVFAPPFAVINDFEFLRSLPESDWIGGVAEAFKVAIIKDRSFFDYLCANAGRLRSRDERVMEETVRRCADLHLQHIRGGGDPFEAGQARPLDFGHWSAHRLESRSSHRIHHGQAVAAGLALDTLYACANGWVTAEEQETILAGLRDCGFPLWYPEMGERTAAGRPAILEGLDDFREHLGGELTVTFPLGIGRRQEVHEVDEVLVEQAIEGLRRRFSTFNA